MLADAAGLDGNAAEGLFTAPDVRDADELEGAAGANADASSSAGADADASRQFAITAQTDGPLLLFFPTCIWTTSITRAASPAA